MSFKDELRQILRDGQSEIEESSGADTWSPQNWMLDIQRALGDAKEVLLEELKGSSANVDNADLDPMSRKLNVRVDLRLLWDLHHDFLGVRKYTLSFRADHAAQKTTAEARFSHRGPAVFSEEIDHTELALATAKKWIRDFLAEIYADLAGLRRQVP